MKAGLELTDALIITNESGEGSAPQRPVQTKLSVKMISKKGCYLEDLQAQALFSKQPSRYPVWKL